ncbi:MAG TPA: protein kinase [Bryobacteraceae bacterium]|nr:protein kinase [Bryobacteraceae bacterium]
MPLSPGERIGPYQIAERIGAGGMGEVYRAADTRMGRDVAIKVSAKRFSDRFSREVHAVAALNHPNVCILHDVGENYLVMELIEGPTLAERIERGPIPIEEALGIAKQIAAALEAAHEKGIVHRDLKPGNIKIKPDGTVKVLDFGLAKVSEAAAAASSENSPTISMAATQAGIILGTAAYMSPEQARGRPVDKRADIWAFGVVLYEMLTGKRLFEGEDLTETLAAVVKDRPDLSEVPAPARRLIERCLEKDPKKRLRDIGDLELLLGDGSPPPVARRSTLLPWLAGALAVALGVALWAPWRVEKQVGYPLRRLDVDLGEDVSLPAPGPSGSAIAISPDGTRLVYVSGTPTRLFTRRLDQTHATELPGTQGGNYPFFSPDGQWIGFATGDRLEKISVEGGAVVPFGNTPNFGGASWVEDGSIIASDVIGKGLVRYAAAGGPPQPLPGFSPKDAALAPQILPGGKAVLFTDAQMSADVDQYTIGVLTLADGHRKIVARGGVSARYVGPPGRPGHLIYVNKTALFAVPFDPDKLETRGSPVPVLDGVAIGRVTGMAQFDCSPGADGHGILVYRKAGANSSDLWTLDWIDEGGKTEPLPVKPGAFRSPRVSPDGERVALMVTEGGHTDIWVYDPRRDAMTRRTFGDGYYGSPIWSPDGRYIVYESLSNGIFQARADGSAQPQVLMESSARRLPFSFTADGKRLAYEESDEGRWQIWTVPLEEEEGWLKAGKPEPFFTSSSNDERPSFSPDGRWLAYDSDESGKREVYVRAFPPSAGPGGKWQISNSDGQSPGWSRNGHDLLYRSGLQIMAVSYTVQGGTFEAEKPRVWIAKMGTAVNGGDLAPDGKRILVVTQGESAEGAKPEHEVVFLENFFDYLRQRAPIGK